MVISERRAREREARERLILDTARRIAESDGWDGVTIRRLADEIDYSQPVLYSHFDGKDAIRAGVALDGFAELADRLGRKRDVAGLAAGYLSFARAHPATYDAMFAQPTSLALATGETPAALTAAFATVVAVAGDETRAEVLWAALHGLAGLERGKRLRSRASAARLRALVAAFGS